jgi:glyoxylate/hydroxypyruvate reductase
MSRGIQVAETIAFVSRLEPDEAQGWLEILRQALPDYSIEAFGDLSQSQRALITIAVVADPAPEDLKHLPALIWLHSLWAGVERLVASLPDTLPIVRLIDPELSRAMGEAALAWVYYLQRDMPTYAVQQSRKQWQPLPYRAPGTISVGVLGLGEMGLAASVRLRAAGFKVTGWSRTAKAAYFDTHFGAEGLKTVLSQSDIVVCLLPLTPQTRGLIDAGALAMLPDGASLINFARGPVVVTEALLAALDRGKLAHAVLDVFDAEPLPSESPLWSHPKVTVLPHISAPTTPQTAAAIVARNIRQYRLTGQLPPTVDRGRGY